MIKQNIQNIVRYKTVDFNGIEKKINGQENTQLMIKIIIEEDMNINENQSRITENCILVKPGQLLQSGPESGDSRTAFKYL